MAESVLVMLETPAVSPGIRRFTFGCEITADAPHYLDVGSASNRLKRFGAAVSGGESVATLMRFRASLLKRIALTIMSGRGGCCRPSIG